MPVERAPARALKPLRFSRDPRVVQGLADLAQRRASILSEQRRRGVGVYPLERRNGSRNLLEETHSHAAGCVREGALTGLCEIVPALDVGELRQPRFQPIPHFLPRRGHPALPQIGRAHV